MKKEFDYSKGKQIEIIVDAHKVTGWYLIKDGMIMVSSHYGMKTTQIGGSMPENLAKILLRELAKENE